MQHMDNTLDVSFRRGTSITTMHVCDGCTGARARPSNEEWLKISTAQSFVPFPHQLYLAGAQSPLAVSGTACPRRNDLEA